MFNFSRYSTKTTGFINSIMVGIQIFLIVRDALIGDLSIYVPAPES